MATSPDSITGTGVTKQRATCWSITINNPTESDYKTQLPPGWKLTGQLEKGKEGTEHYQGMLQTPQVRFGAVKKALPRAHIEVARNKAALTQYVHKDDTRVGTVTDNAGVPSLFDYQHTVARKLIEGRDESGIRKYYADCDGNILPEVEKVVFEHIKEGMQGIEYIAINPMWISAWKKFGLAMLLREWSQTKDRQTDKTESKEQKIESDIDDGTQASEDDSSEEE